MHIDFISAVPELLDSPLSHSMMKRAVDMGLATFNSHNLRDFSSNNYRQIDDYQYGGGAGMVLMCEPLAKCIDKLKSEREYDEIIYLTPDGNTFNQSMANSLSLKGNLMMICGHYKGIDQRIRDTYVTMEISIGDYVLTGGELAAALVADSVVRLIPGVLGNEESALSDSFQDNLLAPPVYTRPSDFRGQKVPDVLLSGHQKNIDEWRMEMAMDKTRKMRPDLLDE
jgi:tRNA (guanine37-N1)-methyltransferase